MKVNSEGGKWAQKNRLSAATTLLYCFDYSSKFPWYPGRDLNSYSLTALQPYSLTALQPYSRGILKT